MNVRFLLVTVATIVFVSVANAQCFTSASGALCCPETFPCSSTRCVLDISCNMGAASCTSNVCRRPGSTPPPTAPPPPAPAPAPSPEPAPAPAPAPASTPAPQQNNQGNPPQTGSTPYDSLLECNGRRTRREVRDMSQGDWDAFANAVNELKRRPSRANPNTNQFEDLARIHSQFVVEAHGGSFFLPWHRLFILLLENLLREVNPSVTLPYWNWAADAADPAVSTVWNRVGGSVRNGQNSPTCIPFGPFENMQTNHQFPHCVARGFISGQSGSFPSVDNLFTIESLINSDVSFPRFAAALESTHGTPHVGIGGDMATLGTAPNDPAFFLHHSYVDSIFYDWQMNGNGRPGRFSGNNPGSGPVTRDSVMQAFQRTVRYSQNLRCVTYEPFSGSFGVNSGALNLTVAELPPEFIEKNHLNKTRITEGRATLQEVVDKSLGRTSQ